ncbi:MAG: BatA domain-containing protein [Planctomycetes bacterium]|nr:BatA domain-containing protein [Planctomycetota bacterium]
MASTPLGLFEGFVHPALVVGTSLAAVPLVIHLLNRQRHKPMTWAAMRFVLAAYKKTRRRARFENWLLLLLRMAAVALFALAIARPFVGKDDVLSGLTETRRDMVLVLDASASTGWRTGTRSVFEGIVERARELVLELDSNRGDRVRLLSAAGAPRLLSWRTPEEALDMLGTLREPTDEALDLAAALSEVASHAEEQAGGGDARELEVRLLSDLQRRDFLPPTSSGEPAAVAGRPRAESAGAELPGAGLDGAESDSPTDARLFAALDRLKKLGVKVRVEDLGPQELVPPNLAIADLSLDEHEVAVDVPLEVGVRIANHGATATAGVKVVLEVDGERRPAKLVDVPARGAAAEVFEVTFRHAGAHTLVARLESDRLAIDDARAAVIAVPPPLRILLVDGAPSSDVAEDEVGYLAAVLAPLDDAGLGGSPFETRVIEPAALRDGSVSVDDFDLVWLANVDALSDGVVEKLEKRVAAGAGLVVSLGDQVQAEVYDRRFFAADGSGLLPAELAGRVSVPSRRESYFRAHQFDAQHPALAFFADEKWRPLFTEVPVYEFVATRPLPAAHVLARLDDEAQSPLLVEKAFDRGRVMLLTTTIDTAWTRIAESPRTLVPLVHELVRWVGRPRGASRNVAVGRGIELEVAEFPRSPVIVRPDGARAGLAGEAVAAGPNAWRLPRIDDTARVGLYRVEFSDGAAQSFAVQLDPRESDLERIGASELSSLHPALVPVSSLTTERSREPETAAPRGELWRWLAIAALAALVLETLWSAWIGRARSVRP